MEVSTIGENSIRSAYLNTMLNILDTSHLKHEGDLPTLWKLSLPPTIRNFLWRLLQGCLPTRHNLRKKHIECQLNCIYCNSNTENEWHLFILCPYAKQIWLQSNLWQIIEKEWDKADNFNILMFSVLQISNSQVKETLLHKRALIPIMEEFQHRS